MIKSFKSKALKLFWDDGDASKLPAAYIRKITMVLQKLDVAQAVPDDFKSESENKYKIHPLKGSLKDRWSLTISANYRIIFRFVNGDVYDLDYIDYH